MTSKWETQKLLNIQSIKEKIKDNDGITLKELVSRLSVEKPFMSRIRAIQLVEDLHISKQIEINKDGVVSLCP